MPPMPARRWYEWKALPLEASTLEERLGWPRHSVAILNQAFAQKLDRETGWETNLEPGVDPKPFSFAASVFRRGVAYRPSSSNGQRGTYEICFRKLNELKLAASSFVVVDQRVADSWKDLFAKFPHVHVFDMNERTKTLESVAALRALWRKAGRLQHWVIIGGGVLADTAGFTAALEGCPFTLVPTTLLAMVDACVGGKTGVNHAPYGKNQIGLFAFPDAVRVFPEFLSTLHPRELRAGWAEAFKHALLTGEDDLLKLFKDPVAAKVPPPALLARFIAIKAEVVAKDPAEHGLRAILNLGHTLAHALEAVALENTDLNAPLYHGEAVALGLLFCVMLSAATGTLNAETHLLSLIQSSGILPSRLDVETALGVPLGDPGLFSRLFQHFAQDKKAGGGHSRWILLDAPGCVRRVGGSYLSGVSRPSLEESWQRFVHFSF